MARTLPLDEELQQLLTDHVSQGLSADEHALLQERVADHPGLSDNELEQAAVVAALAFRKRDEREHQMPHALRSRLLDAAPKPNSGEVVYLKPRESAEQAKPAPAPARWFGATGWAAAAVLALALVVIRPDVSNEPSRSELLAESDVVQWDWRTENDATNGYEAVSGDVVWSDSAQAGYMRFSGLPVNNPAEAQYQLWIIDPARDDVPVDGGVFDAQGGELVIPIQAKLAISDPKAFAITLEQPGGVVVSDGPLLLIAALGERPNDVAS